MPITIKTWVTEDGAWDKASAEPGRRVLITGHDGRVVRHYATDAIVDGPISDADIISRRSTDLCGAPIQTAAEVTAAAAADTVFTRQQSATARARTFAKARRAALAAIAPASRTPQQRQDLAVLVLLLNEDDGE